MRKICGRRFFCAMKSTRMCMFWRAILCLEIHFYIAQSQHSGCSETGKETLQNINFKQTIRPSFIIAIYPIRCQFLKIITQYWIFILFFKIQNAYFHNCSILNISELQWYLFPIFCEQKKLLFDLWKCLTM